MVIFRWFKLAKRPVNTLLIELANKTLSSKSKQKKRLPKLLHKIEVKVKSPSMNRNTISSKMLEQLLAESIQKSRR